MNDETTKYAGFWIRLLAGLLDLVFLFPLLLILIFAFGLQDYYLLQLNTLSAGLPPAEITSDGKFATFLEYGLSIAYLSYFIASNKQATIGKRLLGIYVGNIDGSKLTPLKSLGRSLAPILTIFTLGLGFIAVIFTKEKVSLHDFICKTRVFYGRK